MEHELKCLLGKKLVFHASYREMREILEDYEQTSEEGSITETPKDIKRFIDESRHRAVITYIILMIVCLSNLWLFAYLDSHRYLSFVLQSAVPFFLSIFVPCTIFITFGKKLVLLSKLCFDKKNSMVQIYCINIVISLVIFIFCSMDIYIYYGIEIHYIQNIFSVIVIGCIILFGYLVLTRGIFYYLGLCGSYIMFCTLYQFKAVESQLSNINVYWRNIKIVFVCYFAAILLSIIWTIILKKQNYLK